MSAEAGQSKKWRKLRRSLRNVMAKADKKGMKHWSKVFSLLNSWLKQKASPSSLKLSVREYLHEGDSGKNLNDS